MRLFSQLFAWQQFNSFYYLKHQSVGGNHSDPDCGMAVGARQCIQENNTKCTTCQAHQFLLLSSKNKNLNLDRKRIKKITTSNLANLVPTGASDCCFSAVVAHFLQSELLNPDCLLRQPTTMPHLLGSLFPSCRVLCEALLQYLHDSMHCAAATWVAEWIAWRCRGIESFHAVEYGLRQVNNLCTSQTLFKARYWREIPQKSICGLLTKCWVWFSTDFFPVCQKIVYTYSTCTYVIKQIKVLISRTHPTVFDELASNRV